MDLDAPSDEPSAHGDPVWNNMQGKKEKTKKQERCSRRAVGNGLLLLSFAHTHPAAKE
jgi:hypothetical protein